jgi:SAM-dependent methyltransferase
MTRLPDFVCPVCRTMLDQTDLDLFCASCNKTYPVLEGIPIFVSGHHRQEFYEGRWSKTKGMGTSKKQPGLLTWYREFRYQYQWQRARFFSSMLHRYARGASILDLGCGGGHTIFPKFGPTIGLDLSFSSLRNAARIYQRTALADTSQLPFEDSVFDVVLSSEVLGHIPLDLKDAVLCETKRVLRDGGISIHAIETLGVVRRFAQNLDPELFEQYFIQQYGHVGMELPSETIARFERCGFETLYARNRWNLLWLPEHYLEGFNNEYRRRSHRLNMVMGVLAWLHYNPFLPIKLLRDLTGITIGLLSPLVDAVLPFEGGNTLYAAFRIA